MSKLSVMFQYMNKVDSVLNPTCTIYIPKSGLKISTVYSDSFGIHEGTITEVAVYADTNKVCVCHGESWQELSLVDGDAEHDFVVDVVTRIYQG